MHGFADRLRQESIAAWQLETNRLNNILRGDLQRVYGNARLQQLAEAAQDEAAKLYAELYEEAQRGRHGYTHTLATVSEVTSPEEALCHQELRDGLVYVCIEDGLRTAKVDVQLPPLQVETTTGIHNFPSVSLLRVSVAWL